DDAGIGLIEHALNKLHVVQHGVILEALRAEDADAAAFEHVVNQEHALPQRAAGILPVQAEVLEAAEGASLNITHAVDQTDIELAFRGVAGVIDELALRLYRRGSRAAEGREELASRIHLRIARTGAADVGPDVQAK